jgi:hypothetical protein
VGCFCAGQGLTKGLHFSVWTNVPLTSTTCSSSRQSGTPSIQQNSEAVEKLEVLGGSVASTRSWSWTSVPGARTSIQRCAVSFHTRSSSSAQIKPWNFERFIENSTTQERNKRGRGKVMSISEAPTGDEIARCVLRTFEKLPPKFKPTRRSLDAREWVPLSGIVLSKREFTHLLLRGREYLTRL